MSRFRAFIVMGLAMLIAGCESSNQASATKSESPTEAKPAIAAAPAEPAKPAVAAKPVAAAQPVIRIKAGVTSPFTDSAGNIWIADKGFADGETTDRDPAMKIENTSDPALYRTERYSMTAFSWPLPNGKYTVKLHFCETYEGIMGVGDRIFSFNVEGKDFKDFDIWAKAGGRQRAYIESVPVEITDGKLDITFTPKVENPEIHGIEIIPGS